MSAPKVGPDKHVKPSQGQAPQPAPNRSSQAAEARRAEGARTHTTPQTGGATGAAAQRASGAKAPVTRDEVVHHADGAHDVDFDQTDSKPSFLSSFHDNFADKVEGPQKVGPPAEKAEKPPAKPWQTTDEALGALKKNPDLSSYTQEQLDSLKTLAEQFPESRKELAEASSGYVEEGEKAGTDDEWVNPGIVPTDPHKKDGPGIVPQDGPFKPDLPPALQKLLEQVAPPGNYGGVLSILG